MMIGTLLGSRYELLEKIGEGGMSIVYKAKCHRLDRLVSVKILKEEYLKDDEFVEKFKREATAAASLSDVNIVNIYDVGTQNDINYIVMEYVNGKTLKDIIIENGRLDSGRAIDIGIQIAKALECAHKNNIIHRDVKPHNILVTDDGVVKVTDFGIAKASTSVTITNTSKVMGSAHYFSPEQAKGSFVDVRTDIYSLGIVLYEMVTGKVPFDAESPVSVALKHIQEPVIPPRDLNPNVPENLNRLIIKAVEKDPIRRYQSAKEILHDLQRIRNNSDYKIASGNYEDEHTRVMKPVVVQEKNEPSKGKNSKKKKAILIATSIVIVILAGVILGWYFAPGGKGPLANLSNKDIVIPTIKGLQKDEAKKLLQSMGLTVDVGTPSKSEKPAGQVIASNPAEGTTVKANSTVRIIVSAGPDAIKVPNLVGADLQYAKDTIKNNGFILGNITNVFDDSSDPNTVIKQSPDPDTDADSSTKIDLVVSKGPEVKYTKVPNLKGLSLDEASRLLSSYKLVLGNKTPLTLLPTDDPKLAGTIVTQSEPVDKQVKEGSAIDVSYYDLTQP